MGVKSFGVCDEGSGTWGYWEIYIQEEEHGGAVHSYSPHSGPTHVYYEEAGIADTNKVMGTGGPDIPREADGGGGGWRRSRVGRGG